MLHPAHFLANWAVRIFCIYGSTTAGQGHGEKSQACLRPRDRFWDIPVPKIDSAFDNLFVPQPSWSPSTTQQLRKLVAAPYLPPNDWTPRSEAYFVFPLAQGTPGKQCGLAATGVYQPSLRSPWLAAVAVLYGSALPLWECPFARANGNTVA
ncbi:hypothetical protein [Thiolapillus sp.]|uniref:hypothetical protein n=4 Tax=Thiolapillus sp. TaxID=2017437 RepID=UPI0025F062D4|nr:hypothetical protein [Thiolapillus sp.]